MQRNADSPELKNGTGQITSALAISFCFPSGSGAVGDPLRVTATATYRWLPSLIASAGLPATTKMTSTVTVRLASAYVSGQTVPYLSERACP